MECPKCLFDNPEDMKFCGKCGKKLERICEKCGFANPPAFKFCGECGHNLIQPPESTPKDLSFDEKLDKIQRYLPEGLTQKILSQRDRIEGERKQVTVMFCDMAGFTPLVEKLGPEEAYTVMDQVYEILIHKVHDYEGTVNEMTGDGIMGLFGAPIALEDAPQRAIRSALSIHREMVKFNEKMKEDKTEIPTLKMRIGIHTGPVVVGTMGNDLRVEFKAVGDTVNLASRMEGIAEPGTAYVTEDTFKLTEGFFRFEAMGKQQVKGKTEPVNVYQVIAPSTRRTRFDVSAEQGLTPFSGRNRELELLLDSLERAKSGHGQVFSIVSEAGVGKSRLLYEFRKAVAGEDITFLEGRCLSYSKGVAYHPVMDILKANFDIDEKDRDQEVTEKVTKGLKLLGIEADGTLPYLLELLSVKESGIDKIPMSPEAKKDRILEAVKRIVLKGTELRSLILAFEDLHWMDKSSEDVLNYVLESIPGMRALMIFTFRPEFAPTWSAKSFHNQVTLNRLSNRESLMMMSELLGTKEMDGDLEAFLLEKTEGVPFFIEEFIRSLKDLQIIKREENKYYLARNIQEAAIPVTLQDVIMARVDSLPDAAKDVLQIGSVIEREFSYTLMKQLTDLREQDLLSHLSALKDSELLYEKGIFPESTYIFKHALTREVIYDSILDKRKRSLHERIANAIEASDKATTEAHNSLLAWHFMASGNYEKAAKYSKLVAKKAVKSASMNEAIYYTKQRIACLENLSQSKDVQRKLIDSRTALALYLTQMLYSDEARAVIEPIVDLALKTDYKRRLPQIYTIMGSYDYMVNEDFPSAFEHLNQALKMSEENSDILTYALASFWLGLAFSVNCEFEKAYEFYGKTLTINTAANNLWATATVKSNMALCNYWYGRINAAFQMSQEAIETGEESGDIYSKSMAYTSHGISCLGKGLFESAEKSLVQGANFCERINNYVWNAMAHFTIGETYSELGEYRKSKAHFEKTVILTEKIKFLPSWSNLSKVAMLKGVTKEKDVDFKRLEHSARKNSVRLFDGWIAKEIGCILLSLGKSHISEAEAWIKKAIEADTRNDMRFNLGRDYVLCAELFKRKGDFSEAKEELNRAIEIFKECGADGWVEKYAGLRDSL